MKKIRMLFGDLIVALISLAIFASWFVLPVSPEPTAPGPQPYTAPSAGAGRITCVVVEEMHDDEQVTGTLESSTETLVLQEETKTEDVFDAVPANYEQVTVNETEEWVECVPEADPVIETDIDALIVQVAAEYGLPWQLVRAVCWVESGFDPYAVSATGDYGLMQVSYVNHAWLGLDDPFDPLANLRAGCRILKDAIENSGGDFTMALMRYNRGDAYARSQWAQGIFSTAYTDRVLGKYYEYLRGEY